MYTSCRPIQLHPINVPVKKEKKRREGRQGRCLAIILLYTPSSTSSISFCFLWNLCPFDTARVYCTRWGARDKETYGICHISAIDRSSSWLFCKELKSCVFGEKKEKCNNTKSAGGRTQRRRALFLFFSSWCQRSNFLFLFVVTSFKDKSPSQSANVINI
jgi:hypothetical protein